MSLFRVVTPADPVVSLSEVKSYLKIENDLEDKILKRLILNATNAIEKAMGIRLLSTGIQSTFTASVRGDYTITVDQYPLANVSVSGSAPDIINTPLETVTDFVNSKVTVKDVPVGTVVVVDAVVGLTDDVELLDGALSQAVMILIGYWYESRDAADIPATVLKIIAPFKRYAF